MAKSKTRDGIPFRVFGRQGGGERERKRKIDKAHGFTSSTLPSILIYMFREMGGRHEPLKETST